MGLGFPAGCSLSLSSALPPGQGLTDSTGGDWSLFGIRHFDLCLAFHLTSSRFLCKGGALVALMCYSLRVISGQETMDVGCFKSAWDGFRCNLGRLFSV